MPSIIDANDYPPDKWRNYVSILQPSRSHHPDRIIIKKVKVKADLALNDTRQSISRDVTFHITQCYLPPDTSERVPLNTSHAGWYTRFTYPGGMEG